jgi:hypothetical protein
MPVEYGFYLRAPRIIALDVIRVTDIELSLGFVERPAECIFYCADRFIDLVANHIRYYLVWIEFRHRDAPSKYF